MNTLHLTYRFTDDPKDDFGWLGVRIVTECFAAENGWWVQWQDVLDFAAQLANLTADEASAVEFNGGYKAPDREDWTDVFNIAVTPTGLVIDVFVKLLDQNRASHRCETGFRTTLGAIDLFQRELEALMRRERDDAELKGTDVPFDE